MKCSLLAAGAVVVLFAGARPTQAQTPGDTVSVAVARRDRGDLDGAIAMLRRYSAAHPEDTNAARLLGETLYWAKQPDAARAVYEEALRRHPADAQLRLQYATMLSETGDPARAREVVRPLLDVRASRGAAESLLGRMAYWEGDLVQARDLFVAALADDAAQAQARTQLREIAALTAAWITLSPFVQHDDQPFDQAGASVGGGWCATPLTSVSMKVTPARFRSGDSVNVSITRGEIALSSYVPASRMELGASAGAVQRDQGTDWTGSASVGVRLPRHVTLRVKGARDPYLYTVASLRTPVTTNTGTALASLDAPNGWMGEAAVQRAWYPDANAVSTAYAWLLAPLLFTGSTHVQVGVSAGAQTSDESRYVLANRAQRVPPSNAAFSTKGVYVPYYTPSNQLTQSALVAVQLHPTAALTARLNGSYGVHATESAPILQVVTHAGGVPTVERQSFDRSYSPYSVRAGIDLAASSALTLGLSGEMLHTAFYTSSSAVVEVTWRFTEAALRRVARY